MKKYEVSVDKVLGNINNKNGDRIIILLTSDTDTVPNYGETIYDENNNCYEFYSCPHSRKGIDYRIIGIIPKFDCPIDYVPNTLSSIQQPDFMTSK